MEEHLVDPADYRVGFDISYSNTELAIYLNDLPIFGVGEADITIGGKTGGMTNKFDLNHLLLPKKNNVRFRFQLMNTDQNDTQPSFKIGLHAWVAGSNPMPFEEDNESFALKAAFWVDLDEDGNQIVKKSIESKRTSLLKAGPAKVEGILEKGNWIDLSFDFLNSFNFAPRKWVNGLNLTNNKVTQTEVENLLKDYHRMLSSKDLEGVFNYDYEILAHGAQAYGISPKEWFQEFYVDSFLNADTQFEPYDPTNCELKIFGFGRLATLNNFPIAYTDSSGEEHFLNEYFYKDNEGNWNPMD